MDALATEFCMQSNVCEGERGDSRNGRRAQHARKAADRGLCEIQVLRELLS
jgi:hypothetical protein